MQYRYEILTQLNKFKNKDKVRLHMPGHKNAGEFRSHFPVAAIDFTELDFSDDLHCPSGVIAKAQADIARIVGAKKAYITTDGSTSGVFCMLAVASKFGNKIIVPRSSHKSVFNACRLFNMEPVIVQGAETEGVLTPPAAELVEKLIENDRNIAGMIVASPDYYGNIAPLESYSRILKSYNRFLFVDGAHGGHLFLEKDREGYAGVYADMWVDGVHKSLPALTQGAVVCVGDENLIEYAEQALSMLRTTSPSYPIMASVEYAVKCFVNNPKPMAAAKAALAQFKEEAQGITLYPSADWTKLAVDFKPLGISPAQAQEILQKKGIYPEFNDGRYILFYLSPSIEGGQLTALKNALSSIASNKKLKGTYKDRAPIPAAERTYSYLYSLKSKSVYVPLKDAAGRMCAENAGITPPCLPVIIAGEIITRQAIELLSKAKNTFGLSGGNIKVVAK